MKKFLLLSLVSILVYSASFAKILRVGYGGIPLAGVDYASVDLANTNASAVTVDTIQIYGNVGGGSITKKVVIIGFGYNLEKNTGLQANSVESPSQFSTLYLRAGSDGSVVTGCWGTFEIQDNSGTHTPISNISFYRCYGGFYTDNHSSYGPVNNVKIWSCVITAGGMQWNAVNDYAVTNVSLYNCILASPFVFYKSGSSISVVNCVSGSNTIQGNFAPLQLHDAGALVQNCILTDAWYPNNVNTVFENNFFQAAAPAGIIAGTNNHWSADFSAIFTRNALANDNAGYYANAAFDEDYWVLKAGSPAMNAGLLSGSPTDCGIYGGQAASRYKLSGVPAVPAIYQLTAPSLDASTNPYNVTISVRSNN